MRGARMIVILMERMTSRSWVGSDGFIVCMHGVGGENG